MMGYNWVIMSVHAITSSALFAFMIYFGIVHNLFNWSGDWWYSLVTLLVWLTTPIYYNKED